MLGLIDQVYAAGMDSALWPGLLDQLGELHHAKSVLFMQDISGVAPFIAEYRGFGKAEIQSYGDYYGARSPWLGAFARIPVGLATTHEALASVEEYEGSEFYHDWVKPQGLYGTIGVMLDRSATVVTNLSLNCYAGRRPVEQKELRFFAALTPHVRRALQVHRQMAELRLQRDSALEALDRLSLGALVLRGDARLTYANPQAERLLRAADGLASRTERLVGTSPAATRELQAAIQAAAAPVGGRSTVMRLPRPAGGHLSLLVVPFRGQGSSGLFGLAAPAALVFVRAQDAGNLTYDPVDLVRLHALTPAEGRLLAALLLGQDLKGYADAAGISINTAKAQLKEVFAKTGHGRQVDLVRQLLADPVLRLAGRRPR